MFILASVSPRRKEILEEHGFTFKIANANIDETIYENADPITYVKQMALNKAKDVSLKYKDKLVVGSDTIVVYNNKIYTKPTSFTDAFNMLSTFSNNTHSVYTAISLCDNNKCKTYLDESLVTFYKLTSDDITNYINKYKPYDKAGSYAVQEIKDEFIKSIKGSYYTIMGFPIELFMKVYPSF